MYLKLLGRKIKKKLADRDKTIIKKKIKKTNSEAGKVELIAGNRQ